MIVIDPVSTSITCTDEKLNDIVQGHICYMECFSQDNDIKYSLLIPESEEDIAAISSMSIDYIDVTGDFFEANIIDDNSVTVAIIHRNLISKGMFSLADN